ncbi:unnamed protein product [Rotaria sp. Silwood2]|nr:unnamed protein product [Rotaria sp. Silwood2]CAF3032569.1 unnamed protein product [Rotaria sp. Silwood2]CAF3294833.1 unnamed protein product [Rotaria sp. Silwood2]CAF3373129.1 unnamed protein product [Rotaria sp. Silwood2]CAF4200444.1 unnamed protein product [Rotaria sp. Silwood2]
MDSQNNSIPVEFQSWFIPIDIINMICCIIAAILSSIFLYFIIVDKTYYKVPMLLVANSCLAELIYAIDLLAMTLFTFHNDITHDYFNSSFCIFLGSISYMSAGIQNYSYLLQAFYRYVLIIRPSRLFFLSMKLNSILLVLTWSGCIIYSIVLVSTGQIDYFVDDQICQMPLQFSFLTIFNAIYTYIYPMFSITFIYARVARHVHMMSKHITPVNNLFHAQRELRMFRRIVSLLSVAIVLGIPYQTFVIMSFAKRTPKYHFRIAFAFIDASLIFVLVALLKITDPLKASLMKRINGRSTNIVGTMA